MFIAVEGNEASGKSTFSEKLVGSLRNSGYKAFYTADPAHTAISLQVRKFICHNDMLNITTLMLVTAARSHHYHTVIKPRLEDGWIVVSDRYVLTSYVYHAEACGERTVRDLHAMGCEALYPFFNFVIDLPVEKIVKRLEARAEEQKTVYDNAGVDQLQKWRVGFLECGKYLPTTYREPILLNGLIGSGELVRSQKEFIEQYLTERHKR